MSNCFIGIDPGKSGGIAIIRDEGTIAVRTPEDERGIWELLCDYGLDESLQCHAVIEKVWGHMNKDSGRPGMARSAFSFGRSYGTLVMGLTAANIPFEECPPQTWQKTLGIRHREKGESQSRWKGRLKIHAQKIFPSVKMSLATSDALLIARFCQLTYGVVK